MKKYDAVVIGWGKAGKTLAGFLGMKGQNVALIEESNEMYGGTCINVGCIPSKVLVNGVERGENKDLNDDVAKGMFYKSVINRKKTLIPMLRKKNYEMLETKETVDLYNGKGSFLSSHVINIAYENGENTQIEGEKIFINTGATTIIPNIPGLRESKYLLTSTSIMNLEELPKELTIIGAGYIGLEFASTYSGFGSKVTIIDFAKDILQREEKEAADRVKTILEAKGVNFILGAKVQEIVDEENKVVVKVEKENGEIVNIQGDKVLAAIGRRPNTDGLNLEKAGIEVDERGAIKVNEKLETTAKNVWAVGDVKGGLQFTYISLDDFRIIRDNVYGNGNRTTTDRNVVPYTTFLSTPLSRVGLSEAQAKDQGYEIKVGKLEAMAIPKGKIEGKSEGLLKVVVDAKTDLILGATLLCHDSHEMINIIALAMKGNLKYQYIRDMIFTHPTMSESLNDLFGSVK